MRNWQDDVRRDYEELKKQFRDTSFEDFKSGDWFTAFVQRLLQDYAKTVDAEYIKRKYPGVHPTNQAKKVVTLAAKHNAISGGITAATITALEIGSPGPQSVITVPAIATAILLDVAFCTRTQLRSTYDLSVIHGAPLSLDDIEDCYLVFLTAMGVKLHELSGEIGRAVGPTVVAYNVRKLLRTGLRRGLQEILRRVGGVRLAKGLTERAIMRLVVPGISIPIASGLNYYFTKRVLNIADKRMIIRGAVVQPLIRLYKLNPHLDKTIALKILIMIGNAGDSEAWSEGQMDALRYCQSTLSLTDEDLAKLDGCFNETLDDILGEIPSLVEKSVDNILDLATVQAALADDNRHDPLYSKTIAQLVGHLGTKISAREVASRIRQKRRRLS